MTLCPACTTRHRAAIEFAATIIDDELAGRRRSQAAADLRAMLPAKPNPYCDRCDCQQPHVHGDQYTGPQPIEGELA